MSVRVNPRMALLHIERAQLKCLMRPFLPPPPIFLYSYHLATFLNGATYADLAWRCYLLNYIF